MRQKIFDAVLGNRLVILGVGDEEVMFQPLALYVTDEETESLCGISLETGGEAQVNYPMSSISSATVTEIESTPSKALLDLPCPSQSRRILASVPSFVVR